jgi:multidrug transporter EmrE-like cation transporter
MAKIYEEVGTANLSAQFLFYTFAVAFLLCVGLALWKKEGFGKWELLFGALIGIPNFYSARFLLASMRTVPAVIAYPTFSVGTILTVTLTGVLFFREKLKARQWIALTIILGALVLLNI